VRRFLVAFAMVATSLVAFSPAPAHASTSCPMPSWSNKDDTGGHTNKETKARKGPYTSCDWNYLLAAGDPEAYDCYVFNNNGVSWTHVTAPNGNHGWILDADLKDGGSFRPC
jgi:hypothetical protein